MQKSDSLRAALTAAWPELGRDAERLTLWVEEGRIRAPMTAARGFTWEYRLNITITNLELDPSVLFLAINDWLRTNQPDLLTPASNAGYTFEADILDQRSIDLHIVLKLTEQVMVATDTDGNTTLQHIAEPDMTWLLGDPALTDPPVNLSRIVAQPGTPPA
jgi:hypothetical protein